jgi:hypothetical protein
VDAPGEHRVPFLDLLAEDSRLNVYAGKLEVRPPGAPTTPGSGSVDRAISRPSSRVGSKRRLLGNRGMKMEEQRVQETQTARLNLRCEQVSTHFSIADRRILAVQKTVPFARLPSHDLGDCFLNVGEPRSMTTGHAPIKRIDLGTRK